jgi:predicted MarR family transcription regulator
MGTTGSTIQGHRALNEREIQMMNRIKDVSAKVGAIIESAELTETLDPRWVEIAKTHLQQGFMALSRAVAKPENF